MSWSYLVRFRRYLRAREIREEALASVDNCQHRIDAILGTERPFDPANDPEHQRLAEDFNTHHIVEEAQADVDEQEKKLTWRSRPATLRLALGIFVGVEAFSCVQLFAARGVDMPDRLFFGLGLAGVVFVIITVMVNTSGPAEEVKS